MCSVFLPKYMVLWKNSRLVLRLYSMSAEKIESTSIKQNKNTMYLVNTWCFMLEYSNFYTIFNISLVPTTGIEPVRYFYRGILSPLRLPVPPCRQTVKIMILDFGQKVKIK